MATPTTPQPSLNRLRWQKLGEYETVTDGTCLYLRESAGSIIAGAVFSTLFSLLGIGYGGWVLFTDRTAGSWIFACLLLLVGTLFTWVFWSSVRRGRWMIVYDRGGPGTPGEIRLNGKRLPVERVRCLSVRSVGGSTPRHAVFAELHDGTYEGLGAIGFLTWTTQFGQQAAAWMGLPFRHSGQ